MKKIALVLGIVGMIIGVATDSSHAQKKKQESPVKLACEFSYEDGMKQVQVYLFDASNKTLDGRKSDEQWEEKGRLFTVKIDEARIYRDETEYMYHDGNKIMTYHRWAEISRIDGSYQTVERESATDRIRKGTGICKPLKQAF